MSKPSGRSGGDRSDLALAIRKFQYCQKQLRRILKDTQKALKDVAHLNLFPLESSIVDAVKALQESALRPPAIVVLGAARARLVNFLLGEELLPSHPSSSSPNGWRWLRLQHGRNKHVRLCFGNEFEIIEPNLPMDFNWKQISTQNLSRNDNLDLSTVMDIELCNPFLENGVQILMPPDLGDLALTNKSPYAFTQESAIKDYETFFTKRGTFLENVFPIILYALDDDSLDLDNTVVCSPSKKDDRSVDSRVGVDIPKRPTTDTFNILKCFKNTKPERNEIRSMNSMSKFYVDYDMKESYESDRSFNLVIENQKENSEKKNSSNVEFQFENLPGLSEENLLDLRQIYELHPNVQVLFVLLSDQSQERNGENSTGMDSDSSSTKENIDDSNKCPNIEGIPRVEKQKSFLMKLVEQLELMSNPLMESSFMGHWLIVDDSLPRKEKSESSPNKANGSDNSHFDVVLGRQDFVLNLCSFFKGSLQKYMVNDCKKLSDIQNILLQQFILSSFDMAREMQIIPKKIQYVADTEQQLYDALFSTFNDGEKKEELLTIMQRVLLDMKRSIENVNSLSNGAVCHLSSECINMKRSVFYSEPPNRTYMPKVDNTINDTDLEDYDIISSPTDQEENFFDEAVEAIEGSTENSNENMRRNERGRTETTPSSLSLDEYFNSSSVSISLNSSHSINSVSSFKQASLDIQRAVLRLLSRNISIQLVKFVDCLRDSYYGTLQRCLESLEEGRGKHTASEAVKQILFATRTVDLQQYASCSFVHALIDQLRRFFQRLSFSSSGNRSCCAQSTRWRRQIALDTVESLSAPKLARLISTQLKDRIRQSHEQFQTALNMLGEHHTARLQQTEELKIAVRKLHAPRFARLCLESESLGDLARHGVPKLGKEIGRGQYGVVYSVKGAWAGFEPCAVKSVVPPDERHFNELAMEFFHTRNLPTHDRIVQLRGSVIDYSYEGGSPAVLLISERLRWDLQCALIHGKMSFRQRMQVAIDIVEGIRYLHSQGLVHRDVKLKNVLLDEANRAKLTDLGFCIPEAMMSGSIVGTPIHMAPELLTGFYDSSVDVYAFGILFWYVCAGHVRLPEVFEFFLNKEQLWSNVKKGLRPERLSQFSDTCWSLMSQCWAADPQKRPLLGDVQPVLESIRNSSPSDTIRFEE